MATKTAKKKAVKLVFTELDEGAWWDKKKVWQIQSRHSAYIARTSWERGFDLLLVNPNTKDHNRFVGWFPTRAKATARAQQLADRGVNWAISKDKYGIYDDSNTAIKPKPYKQKKP